MSTIERTVGLVIMSLVSLLVSGYGAGLLLNVRGLRDRHNARQQSLTERGQLHTGDLGYQPRGIVSLLQQHTALYGSLALGAGLVLLLSAVATLINPPS
ncbi:hypothetical protein OG455_28105 [Kitasatospora sp. NBC_01287]|uniref:hypothetical protein n=1 Tax=Kitasatospora sp. NBC_01287 TaxID=2903573 RepID=UPI002254BD6C|nr:hypothetical protein [Kitasatospora sp. NBC_01287]MCX4749325.1 hypothetical protein [Kitasatospora sp. NBC_01287]